MPLEGKPQVDLMRWICGEAREVVAASQFTDPLHIAEAPERFRIVDGKQVHDTFLTPLAVTAAVARTTGRTR